MVIITTHVWDSAPFLDLGGFLFISLLSCSSSFRSALLTPADPEALLPQVQFADESCMGAAQVAPTRQCRRCRRRGLDPWGGKIPWQRKWQPSPVVLPENRMDRGAWCATVHGVTKSQS